MTTRRVGVPFNAMELRLVAEGPQGAAREIAVEVDGAHAVADLAEAIAQHLGVNDAARGKGWRLQIARTDEWLLRESTVAASGLRTGDRIRLEPKSGVKAPAGAGRDRSSSSRPLWELAVVAGPAAGERFVLGPGEVTLGRGRRSDITLSDDEVSRHHVTFAVAADGVAVTDEGSSNGTRVEGRPVTGRVTLVPGTLLELGRSALRLVPRSDDVAWAPAVEGRVPFNRPPRVVASRWDTKFSLQPPPDKVKKNRLPMATALAPLVIGVAMAAIMRSPQYLAFALLSPVMAVWSYVEDRRSGHRTYEEDRAAFYGRLAELTERMESALKVEAEARRRAAPDVDRIVGMVRGPQPSLWERRPDDADFLMVRLGWADLPSDAELEIEAGGDAELRVEAEQELARHAFVPAVPVTLSLREAGVTALCGPPETTESTARWILAQSAVLQSPRDVVMCAAVPPDQAAAWEWLTWLPHMQSETSPIEAEHFAADADQGRALLDALVSIVQGRAAESGNRLAGARQWSPAVLVLLHGDVEVPRAAVTSLLEDGPGVGVYVLWIGSTVETLPGESGAIAALLSDPPGLTVTHPKTGDRIEGALPDELRRDTAADVALTLAPVRDMGARGGRSELPRVVHLPEALGMTDATATEILKRWERSAPGVDGALGVGSLGPFVVDMRRDGPHALLGGTTGAGKSELLQSLVASMAATHRPDEVTFLLVDYKGGAAFKDCVQLPHTVGYVTDLDGHLVHRALVSLNAELRRREHLLAGARAKDLAEMERKDPEAAPPSLLVVVDEFATLAKELPEFVDGVVNVAQRGRSLGIHMILATQRPAGAINENIRANTNLRIALRMNDVADSEDVIGSKEAALLPRSLPGRAYARTGASELTEFQVAYAGGYSLAAKASSAETMPIVVHDLRRGEVVRPPRPKADADPDRPTDLQRVVEAVVAAAEQAGVPPPARPWVPPLPEVLPLAEVPAPFVGMLDEPHLQRQTPWGVSLEADGSLLVYGAGGTGKTTFLRSLTVALARQASPAELHVYALDFATRGLTTLGAIPHVGGVVPGDDLERVHRVIALVEGAIADRRERFAVAGVTSLEEHRRATGEDIPRILVLLDGWSGFHATFERLDYGELLERVPRLVAEGRSLGVHWVITADRRGAMPMALSGVVGRRLVLRQADPDDYSVLGVDIRVARDAVLPPGRAFVDGSLEVQLAIVGDDDSGEAQMAAVEALGRELSARHRGQAAPPVGSLPAEIPALSLPTADDSLRPFVGIAADTLAPVAVDLLEGHLLVAGPNRSGKTTALATLARQVHDASGSVPLWLFAPRRTALTQLDVWAEVARGKDAVNDLVTHLKAVTAEREPGDSPIVVVVDDAQELANTTTDSMLEELVRLGRDVDAWFVLAAESSSAHRSYSGPIAEVRRDRHGLLLQPDLDIDGDLVGTRLPRSASVQFPEGRGFLVERGTVHLVHVAAAHLGSPGSGTVAPRSGRHGG